MKDDGPQKLLMKLDYEYTKANLSFARLKGTDRFAVDLLKNITLSNGKKVVLHLLLATKNHTGMFSIPINCCYSKLLTVLLIK